MSKWPNIPDYSIDSVLGKGGMATVYLATHKRLERSVALKLMDAELGERYPEFSDRFLREARIAADLSHPHIVQVYDVNSYKGSHYIAMEYLTGGDLSELIKSYIDFESLIRLTEQICGALDYAHSKGYVHRDIKPANILFRDNGDAMVSDFGIAKAFTSTTQMTEFGKVLGTPVYMSPEQASGKDLDGRSDLYSVAVMVYQILTGKPPYEGDTSLSIAIKHINEPVPKMPPPLRRIQPFFDKAMAKNAENRFCNGKELAEALRDGLASIEPDELDATRTMVLDNLTAAAQQTDAAPATNALVNKESLSPRKSTSITIEIPDFNRNTGMGVVAVLLLAGFLIWLLPSGVSQADKARIELLLSSAKSDINAGRYFSPEQDNAHQKYLEALAIAPDYEPTTDAMEYFGGILLQRSEDAENEGDWDKASDLALQAQVVIPGNESVEQQLVEISNAKRAVIEQRQRKLGEARELATARRWSEAIEGFAAVPEDVRSTNAVQQEIQKLVSGLVGDSNRYLEIGKYQDARDSLDHAGSFTGLLLDDAAAKKSISAASRAIQSKENEEKNRRKIAQLLQSAEASQSSIEALSLYHQVITLSPGNTTARQGVSRNSASVLRLAAAQIEQGNTSAARSTLNSLEKIRRDNLLTTAQASQLSTLRSSATRSSAQNSELDTLFDRFDRYMEKPKVRSANKIYQRIIAISKTDRRLPAVRKRLSDAYLDLANKAAGKSDWSDALTYSERGLAVLSTSELQAMKSTATEQKSKQRKKFLGIF